MPRFCPSSPGRPRRAFPYRDDAPIANYGRREMSSRDILRYPFCSAKPANYSPLRFEKTILAVAQQADIQSVDKPCSSNSWTSLSSPFKGLHSLPKPQRQNLNDEFTADRLVSASSGARLPPK